MTFCQPLIKHTPKKGVFHNLYNYAIYVIILLNILRFVNKSTAKFNVTAVSNNLFFLSCFYLLLYFSSRFMGFLGNSFHIFLHSTKKIYCHSYTVCNCLHFHCELSIQIHNIRAYYIASYIVFDISHAYIGCVGWFLGNVAPGGRNLISAN